MQAEHETGVLLRHLKVGERLSFDGGRIVMTLQDRKGRQATLRISMRGDVVVDKPTLRCDVPPLHFRN